MPKRPRLLFTSPLPPPPGGIATWTRRILESDLGRSFELRIVDTALPEKASVSSASRFRVGRALDALRLLAQLTWRLALFRPDLVHVNTPFRWALWRDGLFVWLARLAGARTLLHFRGGDFAETMAQAGSAYRGFVRATLCRVDRLIALDHATEQYLRREFGEAAVRYVPNFVRLEEFGAPPDRAARDGARVEILFVGWLLAEKGVRELLEATRGLSGVRLTLVGPPQPSFVATIGGSLSALGERVRVLPPQPKDEIRRLYAEADIFVLPTYREGFPNVVLEAMAAGLPVVATPVGAIPDAVRDGEEGLLVPARDARALEGALRTLVKDRALRLAMGARARARVEAEFSMQVVVRELSSVYRELAGAAGSESIPT